MVEERLRFVVMASRREHRFTELCGEFGISRQTGYVWLKRYQEGGSAELVNRSRRPRRSPERTTQALEECIVEWRQQRPDWGAKKLCHQLAAWNGGSSPITVRTVHRILERHDLIREPDRQRTAVKRFERAHPNELWQMDFKGPGGMRTQDRVGPLSMLDDHSRFLPALRKVGSTQKEGVLTTLAGTFDEHGVPDAMLLDHGTPWWNPASPWGLTEVAVWIMRQGVRLLFSGIRHPQTQGKVERMHRALRQAAERRRVDCVDQGWLDEFRHEYNYLRPHEALGMATPASRWRPSRRAFQSSPPEWEYRSDMQVLRLEGEGQLCWGGRRWEISNALRRQTVGLKTVGERTIVYYCRTPLREINLVTNSTYSIPVDAFRSLRRADGAPQPTADAVPLRPEDRE